MMWEARISIDYSPDSLDICQIDSKSTAAVTREQSNWLAIFCACIFCDTAVLGAVIIHGRLL